MKKRSSSNIELKKRREALSLSQREMAEALGVSARTYQGWEIGRPFPPYLDYAMKWIEHKPKVEKAA